MEKTAWIYIIIITLVIIGVISGGAFFAKHNPKDTSEGIYCASNGMFTDKMPIQSHRSYCLKSDSKSKTYNANTPHEYSFTIVDDQGNTLKNYAVTHTKQMHVIVVRKDLAYFQHVHPLFNSTTGTFTLSDLVFPADGEYRIFADFAPEGGMIDQMGVPLAVTLSEDVKVGSDYDKKAIGSEENKKTFESIDFTLIPTPTPHRAGEETLLTFKLMRNGQPVSDMEQYLGAFGHSVVLREGSLEFIHVHPKLRRTPHGTLEFIVTFPEAGRYKVFTQFQRAGKVITTDFVVSVAEGTGEPLVPGMDHSMH